MERSGDIIACDTCMLQFSLTACWEYQVDVTTNIYFTGLKKIKSKIIKSYIAFPNSPRNSLAQFRDPQKGQVQIFLIGDIFTAITLQYSPQKDFPSVLPGPE
jgi:hypothetical protein